MKNFFKKFSSSFSLKTLSTLALTSTLALLFSCETIEFPEADNPVNGTTECPDTTSNHYFVKANITIDDVWKTEVAKSKSITSRAGSSDMYFLVYLFDSSGAMATRGYDMANISRPITFDTEITAAGTYTLYGVTNVASGEYISMSATPKPTVTTSSTFTLNTESAPNDVCLGSEELVVTSSQFTYTKTIKVSHIMSKLALTINNVPSDVTSLTVTLPKQANVFDFTGKFTGTTTSQTLTLTKAETANTDGTYNWTCAETIVFPCATGTTSMPINITWSSASATDQVISTSSTYCCTSGKNLSLSTTWNDSFSASATITTNDWSATETGTFNW